MKLTYSITISAGQTINISNDILFKVLPSSVVTFKSGQTSSLYYSSTTLTENNQTIATNITTPYTIQSDGNPKDFYFNDSTGEHDSVIRALMYQNNTNTSNGFTFEFTGDDENWDSNSGVVLDETTNQKVSAQSLVLGERTFYIDAENDFGYKIRFYFKVVGETNPIVSEMSSYTLTEGDNLVVGAKYQSITPVTTTIEEGSVATNWAVFNSFTYKMFDGDTSYANNILLQGDYAKARIMVTLNDSKTYYKEQSSGDVITIVENNNWTELGGTATKEITESDLAGKQITLYMKFNNSGSVNNFSATYY